MSRDRNVMYGILGLKNILLPKFVWENAAILLASARRQLPSDPLAVGSNLALFVSCMRDLGIFINADLTMRIQVTQTRSKCFAAFRQLRSIRQSLSIFVLHG